MRRIPFLFLLAAVFSGCAANDLIVQRQSSMELRLEQLMQAQKASRNEVAAASVQMQEVKELSARQAAYEKDMLFKYEALLERVKITSIRLTQLEAAARQSSKIELVNQESLPEGREESIQAEYMKAFGLFSSNNFSGAAESFNAFVSAYPESEYAPNARYWLGECYFALGRFNEAIGAFERVLEMKPLPKRASDAMLRIGSAWYRLDNQSKGSQTLKLLIEKYPDSEAAAAAAGLLENK
ncbi:MAG: tol-pal system protein YbgF [Geobacteraceae bacterium]|nr:tol-pal system protein YbgF [Geobacteraceae bacterium]